jgi:DNA-binding MarR family transcriptional regulator
MAETDERIDDLAATDAARFQRHFEWVDAKAVEANLEVTYAYAALMAAFSRSLTSIGESRAHGRSKIMRLLFLSEEERMPQHEISRQLGVTSANVTYLIDGMEKEGLVNRLVNQADRRETLVALTEKGDDLARRLVPLVGEFMGTICRDFSEEEKHQFVDLLVRFRHSAEASYLD